MPLTVRGDKRGQWCSSSVSPVCSHSARTSGRNDALPAYTHTHTHMYIHIDERYMSMLTLLTLIAYHTSGSLQPAVLEKPKHEHTTQQSCE